MKISMIPNKIVKLIHASKGDTSLRKWAFEPYDNNGAINVSNIKDQLVYKTENGGTEQLLPVNTSTPTTSFFDGTINYGTDTDVEFTYKQSSYTGKARVKSIKGNTLCWNQLVQNGNFASTSGWSATRGTLSASNNVLSYTITELGSNIDQNRFVCGVPFVQNNKCIFTFEVKPLNTNEIRYGYKKTDNSVVYVGSITPVANQWNRVSVLIQPNASNRNGLYFGIDCRTNYSVNDIIQFRNVSIIDLTKMFGSGNELTIDQFKSLFPLPYYAYNSGSLLNFNGTGIKTTGKNLLPSQSVSSVTGVSIAENNGVYTLNGTTSGYQQAISTSTLTLPKGTYTLYSNGGDNNVLGVQIRSVDGTVTYASSLADASNFALTEQTEVKFRIVMYASTFVNKQIAPQLEFGSSATSYEPYTSSTLSLPISTYFPTGMKDVGTGENIVYDELSDKAITRVSQVDLGDLTYYYDSAHARFYTNITTMKNAAKLKCAMYETVAWNDGNGSNMGVYCSLSNPILSFWNSSYSDPDVFKSAMSGVYLNFELATYTETDIQNASLVCKDIEVPCYLSSGNLVCDATEELTNESGFFDAKLKIKDSSSVAYSSKFKLHVEDL